MSVDVYVSDHHPYYQVWVNGKVYDSFESRNGNPITWTEQWDIAFSYKEALDKYLQTD